MYFNFFFGKMLCYIHLKSIIQQDVYKKQTISFKLYKLKNVANKLNYYPK